MIQELYQALPVPTNIRKYNYQISPKIIMELSEGKSVQIFANIFHTLWRHYDDIITTFRFFKPDHAKL